MEAVADGETGILVPPRDPEALAAAVARVLLDGGLRSRLGAAGKARVRERFSVKAMVEGTRTVYERMLKGEPPPPFRSPSSPGAAR